ncbi:MAG: methyltransferase domain-containing protein [Tepidiformaceae bacterium]
MRRRRAAREARESWALGRTAPLARALNSQAAMAAFTPRVARVISLLELGPERRYLDIGCGTAAYAHLLAERAGLPEPPITLDLAPGPGPVDLLGWPEKLPFRDSSFEAISSFYFLRRFDDDVTHAFAEELCRVLAPGGCALVMEFAPVRSVPLNRLHSRLVSAGCAQVDLRGWGRLAALFTEVGFDGIDLVNVGPFLFPPVPRVAVLLRLAERSKGE